MIKLQTCVIKWNFNGTELHESNTKDTIYHDAISRENGTILAILQARSKKMDKSHTKEHHEEKWKTISVKL